MAGQSTAGQGTAGQGTAGQGTAGQGVAGTPTGEGGTGEGGAGGVPPIGPGGAAACVDGLQPQRVLDADGEPLVRELGGDAPAEVGAIVVWPAAQRVAVNLVTSIGIFDVSSANSDGTVRLVEQLYPDEAGLAEHAGFYDLFLDGDGLIIYARQGLAEGNNVFLSWQPGEGLSELARVPNELRYVSGQLADGEHGIVIGVARQLYRGKQVADDWSWTPLGDEQARDVRPLAFVGDELLVGIPERSRLDDGGGGEGGGGGAGGADDGLGSSARVERWNLEGEMLAGHDVLGNPQAAVPARGGWLIAQTNSFWGSYRAAIDWLSPEDELVRLAEVPVISAGDGDDGAYDVVVHDADVFVANCESGLRRGVWQTNQPVELSEVAGPWFSEDSSCNPTELAVVDGVLVLSGERLDFARLCDQ